MQFPDLLKEIQVGELHKVLVVDDTKYVSFTRECNSCWHICVSDGIDVWLQQLTEDDLDTLADSHEPSTKEAYLSDFRSKFNSEDMSLIPSAVKITMNLGGDDHFKLDLYEATAAERKQELQHVLFRLADKCALLEAELSTTSRTVTSLQQQKANVASTFFDMDSKKKNTQKSKPKQPGMSVINPASKKRKAAKGVVFD